jgi:hypothetical protein
VRQLRSPARAVKSGTLRGGLDARSHREHRETDSRLSILCDLCVLCGRYAGRRILAFLLAATLAVACSEAPKPSSEPPKAELSLSPPSVRIGEHVRVFVSVEHAEGIEVRFPARVLLVEGLDIVSAPRPEVRRLGPGQAVTERIFTVRAFRAGAYTVGPIELTLAGRDGLVAKLSTPSAVLQVRATASAHEEIKDLRPVTGPVELAPEAWVSARGLVILLAGTAVITASAFAVKRWLVRREERRRAPPPKPAHEAALAALGKIRESTLLDEGRVAEFTDMVSDVLRRYLEARFALPAPERTTEEFLEELVRSPALDRTKKEFLAKYLAQCDLVKFAGDRPARRDLEGLYDRSVGFVRETAEG